MRQLNFRLRKSEEEELRRMIREVKVNLEITGIRKKVSDSQVIKFLLFQTRGNKK